MLGLSEKYIVFQSVRKKKSVGKMLMVNLSERCVLNALKPFIESSAEYNNFRKIIHNT